MQFLKTDARPSTYKGIYQTLWGDIIKKKNTAISKAYYIKLYKEWQYKLASYKSDSA